jgi:hypothetical protein
MGKLNIYKSFTRFEAFKAAKIRYLDLQHMDSVWFIRNFGTDQPDY